MSAEPDLVTALRHIVAGEGAINVRATPLNTIVRATAESDPDTARVWRSMGDCALAHIARSSRSLSRSRRSAMA